MAIIQQFIKINKFDTGNFAHPRYRFPQGNVLHPHTDSFIDPVCTFPLIIDL